MTPAEHPIADPGSFAPPDDELQSSDPLGFPGYPQMQAAARERSGTNEAVTAGPASIDGIDVELALFAFDYLGGSMGEVAGERLARTMERAAERGVPFVLRTSTGGARMQEGMTALVQMPKTVLARAELEQEHKDLLAKIKAWQQKDDRVQIKEYKDLVTPNLVVHAFYVKHIIKDIRIALESAAEMKLDLPGLATSIERLLRRAAQVLGLLTQELGIAVAPRLEEAVLERLDLIPVHESRVLLVMSLRAAGVRTVYVDVPAAFPATALSAVAALLNERLAGNTLLVERAPSVPDAVTGGRSTVGLRVPDQPLALELLRAFRSVRFDIFHAGYPYARELEDFSAAIPASMILRVPSSSDCVLVKRSSVSE